MIIPIIVTRGRTDILRRCLDSLSACDPYPLQTYVVCNQDHESMTIAGAYPNVRPLYTQENVGFWRGINHALQFIVNDDDQFCYFGKDVIFSPDWMSKAWEVYTTVFPTGLGLLSFRDDIQNGFSASHGMLTKRWLYVLYGETSFPAPPYTHFFCDSETTQRSKDFGRYVYCHESHVAHLHEQTGFDSDGHRLRLMHDDKLIEHNRYEDWVQGEYARAAQRLNELS